MFFLLLFLAGFSPQSRAESIGPVCRNAKNFIPDTHRAPGSPDRRNPIEHVVVLMQENHSFDNYFGRLNQPAFYGAGVDGVSDRMSNPGEGALARAHHESSVCVADPEHGWDAIHHEWNGGKMDGFVSVNGTKAMGYYDERDIPFYYDIANKFAVADRYFCSALTQTFPNRFFLYAATAFGHVKNDVPLPLFQFDQETIFDRLNKYGVSWKYYKNGGLGYMDLFQPMAEKNRDKIVKLGEYADDLRSGHLPQVAVIDSSYDDGEDEHPKANVQTGQAFVAARMGELADSPYWNDSVLFLTYDEGGGFFDHVAPPEACVPDSVEPQLGEHNVPGRFDRYGVRVPFVAVSPYVKHHFVSHDVYDHTSILKFIETKFNIPALSARDANADGLNAIFDFAHPDFATKPNAGLAKVTGSCAP